MTTLIRCLFSLVILAPVLPAEEVAWTNVLTGGALPGQQNPRWEPAGAGFSTLEGDSLILDSSGMKDIHWKFSGEANDPDWDASKPTTVEVRVRARQVDDGLPAAGHLVVADGTKYYELQITDSEWHTYRIVFSGGNALLYTDGDSASEKTLPGKPLPEGSTLNHIYFGDGATEIGGVTEWEFLRWTNAGAYAP